ncbi:MFS transporter [Spongisporangium articulatum]|uniref:MFS transporter n=1 Tax=Spongisporangium articulatum TaxID=3362603 RepID=A0ABW8AQD4_9ACTN
MSTMTDTQRHHHEHRWAILAVIAVAQLMVVLDATIVNIALPTAQSALDFADDQRQWVITAYALAFGSLLLLGGKVGDLFGRKWAFVAGLVGFAVASAIGGAATNFETLVAARALQGVFGALLAPAALSTLANTFTDPSERGRAFGIFGAMAGGGGAVGLLLGGALTEYTTWRWCFFVNLIFAGVATVGALVLLRNEPHPNKPKVDLLGSALAASGAFMLVYGLSRAEQDGWGATGTLVSLAVGVLLIAAFVFTETRVAHPLLPLRIVLSRARGGAYLAMATGAIALFGLFLFLTYYVQVILGFSPLKAGFAFVPMILCVLISSILTNVRLLPIVGARGLISGGMLLAAAGLTLLSRVEVDSSYVSHVLPALPIIGLGMGAIFATVFNTATSHVAPQDAGVASALVNTSQQVGGSIGTALLSTVAAHATTGYLADHGAATALAQAAGAVHGYKVAFLTSAAIFLAGSVISFLLIRPHEVPVAGTQADAAEAVA